MSNKASTQDLRERLEEVSVKVLDTSQGGGHEQMIPLDDAYRIAMEFAREEAHEMMNYIIEVKDDEDDPYVDILEEWWSQRHPNKGG